MANIPFSGIRDIFEKCSILENQGTDIVHLEIGRPDFDTPEPIKKAGIEAITQGKVHYTSNYGIEPLREKLATKLASDNNVEYSPDGEIVVTSGATEAILVTILGLVGPGDEVLTPDPGWTYPATIRLAGATPVSYQLDSEDEFQPNMAELRSNVTDNTKLLIVNSPNNPTGSVMDRSKAEEIRDFVVDNDLLVLSDEIYERLLYEDSDHHSIGALDGMWERTITINGLSKAYSMTGWRIGYLGAPDYLVDPIIRARQYTSTCAPSISQHAAVRAVSSGLHKPMLEAFKSRRDRVLTRIDRIEGMTCTDPRGAFYAFPTLPHGYSDDETFVFSLLEETGVALVPGSVFSSSYHDRVRIAYSNSLERIDEAFDRIEAWI